jgi:hypothetical protein
LVLLPYQEIPGYTKSKENKGFKIPSSTWLQLILACYGSKMVEEKCRIISGSFALKAPQNNYKNYKQITLFPFPDY